LHACRSTLEDPPEQAPKPEQEKKEPERTAAPLPPEPKAETLSDADIDKDEGLRQSVEEAKLGTELEFVIMVIAVSCVKLLSAHNSTQHTSRKHKV
jgi:hypothetical protein